MMQPIKKGPEEQISLPKVYTVTLPISQPAPAQQQPIHSQVPYDQQGRGGLKAPAQQQPIRSQVTSVSLVLQAKIASNPFSKTTVSVEPPPGVREADRSGLTRYQWRGREED
jgi:hypothetical protein